MLAVLSASHVSSCVPQSLWDLSFHHIHKESRYAASNASETLKMESTYHKSHRANLAILATSDCGPFRNYFPFQWPMQHPVLAVWLVVLSVPKLMRLLQSPKLRSCDGRMRQLRESPPQLHPAATLATPLQSHKWPQILIHLQDPMPNLDCYHPSILQ